MMPQVMRMMIMIRGTCLPSLHQEIEGGGFPFTLHSNISVFPLSITIASNLELFPQFIPLLFISRDQ